MRAVIGYWQLPEDEREFFEFLAKTGTVMAAPTLWAEKKEEVMPITLASYVEHPGQGNAYFGLMEFMHNDVIQQQYFDGIPRFGIPSMETCEIHYRPGGMRDGKLTLSNANAYYDYPNEDATAMIKKDERFIKWAKKVFNWVKKRTPEKLMCNNFPYRATKRVKEAVVSGNLEVALY